METTPAATGLAALRVHGVSKRFGHTVALDGIDLELRAAELLALVGPSGCGKSTLLRVVAGLVPADTGAVWLAGTLVDDGDHHLPPERRHVGLVFQEHALFPHLTVAANVGFGLGRRERAARDGRVDETLALVGLPSHRDRYPHELSGGERQRVALARALAPRPALMLLDEPFASLDPNLRTQVRTDVVRILRDAATPAVFVTHDQSEALALGDRVAVMRAGRIQHLATPWEVFHTPANRFVAAFMGEASFLDLHGDGPVRPTEFGPVEVGSPNGEGQRVVAMVRPDDVAFDVDPDGDAVIIATEFRGSSWCYRIQLASGSTVLADVSHLVQADVGTRVRTRLAKGHRPVVVPDTT